MGHFSTVLLFVGNPQMTNFICTTFWIAGLMYRISKGRVKRWAAPRYQAAAYYLETTIVVTCTHKKKERHRESRGKWSRIIFQREQKVKLGERGAASWSNQTLVTSQPSLCHNKQWKWCFDNEAKTMWGCLLELSRLFFPCGSPSSPFFPDLLSFFTLCPKYISNFFIWWCF